MDDDDDDLLMIVDGIAEKELLWSILIVIQWIVVDVFDLIADRINWHLRALSAQS